MVALKFGYKLFDADTVDGLTVEQYNILIGFLNMQAEEAEKQKRLKPNTTSIVSVEEGLPGVNYGDD